MEGRRLILDDRHAVRQHKVFAIFVVLGLLIVLAVWYIQVRMAFERGALVEVRDGLSNFSQTWQTQWESSAVQIGENSTEPAEKTTADGVVEVIERTMQEQEAKDVLGTELLDALEGNATATQAVDTAQAGEGATTDVPVTEEPSTTGTQFE